MPKPTIEELKQKRAAIDARIRSEEAKSRARNRKLDTRRKVLAGAAVLYQAEQDAAFKEHLNGILAGFLSRKEERELFGLPEVR